MANAESLNFSFAGCGFLGVYHLGVADCLQQFVPEVLSRARLAGASAGSLVAACMICKVPLDTSLRSFLGLAKESYRYPMGAFDSRLPVSNILRESLEAMLPQDAHELCSGRLFVSVSRVKHTNFLNCRTMLENEIISQFPSREKLIETLLCSSHIPVFSSTENAILDEKITIDGFFSDNLPRVGDNTVLICPLAGDTHICPQDPEVPYPHSFTISNNNINTTWENMCRVPRCFFAPSPEQFEEIYQDGFEDAFHFLERHRFFRCSEHEELGPRPLEPSAGERYVAGNERCMQCVKWRIRAERRRVYTLGATFQSMAYEMRHVRRCSSFTMSAGVALVKLLVQGPPVIARFLHLLYKVLVAIRHKDGDQVLMTMSRHRDIREQLTELKDSLEFNKELMKQLLMRGELLLIMKYAAVLLDGASLFVGFGNRVGVRWLFGAIIKQLHKEVGLCRRVWAL